MTSYKKLVQKVFSNARLVEDTRCGQYHDEFADTNKYIVVTIIPQTKEQVVKMTNIQVIKLAFGEESKETDLKLEIIGDWAKSRAKAWKNAWNSISEIMMDVLES